LICCYILPLSFFQLLGYLDTVFGPKTNTTVKEHKILMNLDTYHYHLDALKASKHYNHHSNSIDILVTKLGDDLTNSENQLTHMKVSNFLKFAKTKILITRPSLDQI
jgi:hypothetical protein